MCGCNKTMPTSTRQSQATRVVQVSRQVGPARADSTLERLEAFYQNQVDDQLVQLGPQYFTVQFVR